jgi:tetratricopeptide (TPR) repeat protein
MQKAGFLFTLLIISQLCVAQLNSEEALATQYFKTGEFDKAAAIYKKLFAKTKNLSYYDPYFISLLRTRQYDEAEQLTYKLAKNYPENYNYAVDLGRVYQERGQQEKSADWYNDLIKGLPVNEFAIRDLSAAFYRAEAFDYSVKALLAGRKLMNDQNAFAFDLISLYRYQKDKVMLIQEYLNFLVINPDMLTQAENTLSAIFENNADYDLLKNALLHRLQKDPQNIPYAELLTWQFIQQKQFDMALKQTLALDRRLKENGERVYELSQLLLSNNAYDQTIEALNYLAAKGPGSEYYIPAKTDLINTKSKLLTANKYTIADLAALEKDYISLLSEFGRSPNTSFAIRQLANLQAFYLHKTKEAETEMENLLQTSGLPKTITGQTKLELGDIYILTGEVWEAALIYGQVEKQFANDPIGQEAKFRNAKLSYYQGDFDWAKAQLDVLKSSTSQLFANDALNLSLLIADNLQNETDTGALKKFASADLLIYKNEAEKALSILDSINILFPKNSLADDILMAKARIYLKNNTINEAVVQLQKITDIYSADLWGDDAVFMLAEIYETKLNQPEKAQQFYQKIITDYPGSLYVIEARKRFRHLRGDKPG